VVRDHSRSLAMSPFDTPHRTSYSTLIETMFETMYLSSTGFDLQQVTCRKLPILTSLEFCQDFWHQKTKSP